MSTPLLDGDGWTFDALADADLPHDVGRYEVVDGCLLLRPPDMTVPHDDLREDVARWLDPRLPPGWRARCEVAVRLGTDGRRADFGIVRAESAVRERQVGRFPEDIAMLGEVVSPGSRKLDRSFKPLEYAAAGIGAYWRVELDPEPLLVVHALVDGRYEVVQELTGRGPVTVPFPLEIDLPALVPPLSDRS